MVKKISIIFLLILAGFLGFYCALKRNAPKAIVRESLRTYHYPASFVSSLKNDPNAGKKIYQQYCQACHARNPIIDVHAPAKGDVALWRALQQSFGEDGLWRITLMGRNAMPARGGCFECSDEQLRLALVYLREDSRQQGGTTR